MVGEHQWPARFQRRGHAPIHLREAVRELLDTSRRRVVAGQFVRRSRERSIEPLRPATSEPTEPHIAEIHQLRILHVAKVRRIRQNGIDAFRSQLSVGGTPAMDAYFPPVAGPAANSLVGYRYPAIPLAFPARFIRTLAIGLGPDVLLHDVRPPARPHAAGSVADSEQVRLALDQSDRESVNGEHVQCLQSHRVVPAQHILVAEQVREVRGERPPQPFVGDVRDAPARQFQAKQLPRVEQLAVAAITPTVEAVRLVTRGNRVARDEARLETCELPCRLPDTLLVGGVRLLEEAPLVPSLAPRIVILNGEQSMLRPLAVFPIPILVATL